MACLGGKEPELFLTGHQISGSKIQKAKKNRWNFPWVEGDGLEGRGTVFGGTFFGVV